MGPDTPQYRNLRSNHPRLHSTRRTRSGTRHQERPDYRCDRRHSASDFNDFHVGQKERHRRHERRSVEHVPRPRRLRHHDCSRYRPRSHLRRFCPQRRLYRACGLCLCRRNRALHAHAHRPALPRQQRRQGHFERTLRKSSPQVAPRTLSTTLASPNILTLLKKGVIQTSQPSKSNVSLIVL